MKTDRYHLIAISFIGVLFAAAAIADDHERVEKLLEEGRFCMKKDASNQALELFTTAAHLEPNNPEPYYERGRAYGASGGGEAYPDDFSGHFKNIERSIANYSEAIRLNPNYSEAYCGTAGDYLSLRDFDRAIADCTRAIDLGEKDSRRMYFTREMYVVRGDAYLEKGNANAAIEDFTRAVEWSGHACVSRGKIFQARGDFDKAMADYNRAARLRFSEGFLARGQAYAAKGHWDQAISDFTTYCEQTYCACSLPRGKVYLEKGDLDKAIAEFNEVIKYEPEQQEEIYCDPDAHRCRGLAYQKKGDHERAEKDFSQAKSAERFASFRRGESCMSKRDAAGAIVAFTDAIRLNPHQAIAYYRRANAYARQGDLQRALADYDEAIRLRRTSAASGDYDTTFRYYENRGNANLQLGNYDMAIADCNDAIRVLGRGAIAEDAYIYRAQAYTHKGDLDKAIADCSQVTQYRNDAYYYRGEAHARKGDLDKAITDFSEAIRRDATTTGDAYLSRGKAYAERGNHDKAIADFTEVIDRVDLLFYGRKPRSAEAYYRRGLVRAQEGEKEQAEKDITQARKLGYGR